MDKKITVINKAMELLDKTARSQILGDDDKLLVASALMAVTRNMYERALGPEQTQQMFLAVAESFNIQEEILQAFKDARPTIH